VSVRVNEFPASLLRLSPIIWVALRFGGASAFFSASVAPVPSSIVGPRATPTVIPVTTVASDRLPGPKPCELRVSLANSDLSSKTNVTANGRITDAARYLGFASGTLSNRITTIKVTRADGLPRWAHHRFNMPTLERSWTHP